MSNDSTGVLVWQGGVGGAIFRAGTGDCPYGRVGGVEGKAVTRKLVFRGNPAFQGFSGRLCIAHRPRQGGKYELVQADILTLGL